MDIKRIVLLSVFCVGIGAGAGIGGMWLRYKDDIKFADKFRTLAEADKVMAETKLEMNQPHKMEELLLNGYLSAYDKYTRFYPDDTLSNRVRITNGMPRVAGCGYRVDVNENGQLYISAIEEDGIAYEQGLREGDIILKIGESDLSENLVDHVKELYKGEDAQISLEILRGREDVHIDFVRNYSMDNFEEGLTAEMLDDNILYINIRFFDMATDADFGGKAAPLLPDARGVIIDLRGNGGGDGNAAVAVADRFAGAGSMTKYYYKGGEKSLYTVDSDDDAKVPVIILVNDETASASEIMTAFLKQYANDVTIVGTNTFGKGIFQEEEYLKSGGTVYYTAGYLTVGDWECYQDKGIIPDVEVPMEKSLIGTDKDVQMQKALEILG